MDGYHINKANERSRAQLNPRNKPVKSLSDRKQNIHNGCWFMLHFMAMRATTPDRMRAYEFHFKELCRELTGCDCDSHCNRMIEENPPSKYFGILDDKGKPEGCFYHSWMCHNLVNNRLGVELVSYEAAKAAFAVEEIAPCVNKGAETPSFQNESIYSSDGYYPTSEALPSVDLMSDNDRCISDMRHTSQSPLIRTNRNFSLVPLN